MSRILSAAVAAAIAATAVASHAVLADYQGGQGTTGVGTDPGGGVTVSAGTGGSTPGAPPRPSGGAGGQDPCTYHALNPVQAGVLNTPTENATTGTWWVRDCPGGISNSYFVPKGSNSAANPAVLAQNAVSQLHLPGPSIGLTPPTHQEVVGIDMWLWVNGPWQPVSATAAVGAVSSTATAAPAKVVWSLGDGHQVVCAGPGRAFTGQGTTDCSYTYTQSSAGQPGNAYTITATVYYNVTWTSVGAPGGGNLGQIASPPTTMTVGVGEIQALNGQP